MIGVLICMTFNELVYCNRYIKLIKKKCRVIIIGDFVLKT